MYFPYLRGKQYELLALRELVKLPLDSTKIIPIIEPVRKGFKSLETALAALNSIEAKVQLIVNPLVGQLTGGTDEILNFIDKYFSQGGTNIIPTFLIHSDADSALVKSVTRRNGYDTQGYSLIHLAPIRKLDELSNYSKSTNCLFNSIYVNHIFALRRKYDSPAILADYFRRQRVNADYANDVDETFSSDCFFYKNEGFTAFADFQGIGADWIDGGRLPQAVVIHLTYYDPGQTEIRIYHFVSDTNDDTIDVAGKFYEAVTKLVDFADQRNLNSMAIHSFRDLHSRQAYPGLGVIKKLSIMHHIEILQGFI